MMKSAVAVLAVCMLATHNHFATIQPPGQPNTKYWGWQNQMHATTTTRNLLYDL